MTDTVNAPTGAGPAAEPGISRLAGTTIGLFRITLGWLLLWAGADKFFGLGHPTAAGQSVLDGSSATEGYLTHGIADGAPASAILSPLAGNIVVDALYLAVTIGGGLVLLLGILVRLAATGAIVFFGALWFSSFPLEYNPAIDQHLVYALGAALIATLNGGRFLGLGRRWEATGIVRSRPWLT